MSTSNLPEVAIQDPILAGMYISVLELDKYYEHHFGEWMRDLVITIDETKGQMRPWPGDEVNVPGLDRSYIDEVCHALETENRIAFPKSRRLMLTWTLAGYTCWRIRYKPLQAGFWQSEKFEKASYALKERVAFIEGNLKHSVMRRRFHPTSAPNGYKRISYQHVSPKTESITRSWVMAIEQGDTALNAYTPSFIILDECELQPYARDMLANTLPMVEDGVQIILCSSSQGPTGVLAGWCSDLGFARWS